MSTRQEMRIAIITTSYPLTEDATSGVFIKRLVDNLPDNINATVLTPCPGIAMADDHSDKRIECFRYAPANWQTLAHQPGGIPVALQNNKAMILVLPFMLTAMLIACVRISRHVDLLHANWTINGVIAGIAGKLTNTPVITTLRGSDVIGISQPGTARTLLKWCLRLNRKIITVSEAINKQVSELFPTCRDRITTIPNGVGDVFLSLPADRQNGSPVIITTIGSLIPRKRTDTLIHAAARVAADTPIRLRIAGAGSELEKLNSLAQAAAGDRLEIEFLGSLSPDDIPELLSQSDIFVLSSEFEGRPNVVLEAMAAGIPVIASDIDGIRELVRHGETGLLFPVGDIDKLADRVADLSENPEMRNTMGRAARQFILDSGLSWLHCAGQYHDLYKSCIPSSR